MARYKDTDLTLTESGDLLLTEDGDLSLSTHSQRLREQISARIKTQLSDWFCYQLIGTNLEDLIGLQNTQRHGEIGKDSIVKALTYDNLVNVSDLDVLILPLLDKILYKIKVRTSPQSELLLTTTMDFSQGIEVE